MVKKIFLISILIFLFQLFLFSGTQYYRLSYRDDPSTTIVIGWSDLGTSTNAKVYFDVVDHGQNFQDYAYIKSIDRTQNYKDLNNQFARLNGLIPNTVYYFVIRDDQSVSNRMIFKTLPDNANTPITFIAGGDSRTGSIIESGYSQCRPNRQDANRLVAKLRPSFVAFNGDYVFSIPDIGIASTNGAWADWFADWQLTMTLDGQLIPIVPVFGNHELTSDVYNMFDIPNSDTYYSLPIGGNLLRLYTLNTEINCDATQQNWLANDLQLHTNNSSQPYWKFAQYHYPFVPHSNYTPNTVMINCWAQLFQTNKVKLISEAHAHIMKVTWPIITSTATGSDNGFIRNDTSGIVYIGEGSWGAPMRDLYTYFSETAAFNWTRNQEKIPGFHLICVSKQKIEVRTIKIENILNVGQVPLNAPACMLPQNIVLWSPSNGNLITINNNDLSTDASLMSLSTSQGTLSPVFNPSNYTYNVVLPAATSIVPTVSATISDPNSTMIITQATNLTGNISDRTAIVSVTADDEITTKVYSVLFTLDPTEISSVISGNQAVIYPNPSKDIFTIDFFNKQKLLKIEVYNSMGKLIKSEKISTNSSFKLDLSKELSGTYFIYLRDGKMMDQFKVSLIK